MGTRRAMGEGGGERRWTSTMRGREESLLEESVMGKMDGGGEGGANGPADTAGCRHPRTERQKE